MKIDELTADFLNICDNDLSRLDDVLEGFSMDFDQNELEGSEEILLDYIDSNKSNTSALAKSIILAPFMSLSFHKLGNRESRDIWLSFIKLTTPELSNKLSELYVIDDGVAKNTKVMTN